MKTCLLNYLLCIKCSTKLKLCFYLSSGSSKVVCSPWTVQAHLGQDVVLSCRVEPPINLTAETLEWKRGPAFVHVYRSGGDNYDDQDLRFKNRTILNHQNLKDGNISLTLTNVTKEDEGTYTFSLMSSLPLVFALFPLVLVLLLLVLFLLFLVLLMLWMLVLVFLVLFLVLLVFLLRRS
uniref:Ig-like domain-containing protein n=1 Tax=Oryzias latipes TaxID=8090 RepID=A0A3P9JN67_ORYLA